MHDQNEVLRKYFSQENSSQGEDPESVELAYWLQNSTPNDPAVLERLVYRYADDLYSWVEILLNNRKITNSSQAEILDSLKRVFGIAIKNVEQFHGKESVSDWLFAIAYQVAGGKKTNTKHRINLRVPKQEHELGESSQIIQESSQDNLQYLPERLRSTLLLRYRYGLALVGIANILTISPKEVHQRLIKGRKILLQPSVKSQLDRKIQAYVDGLLDDDPSELQSIHDQMVECDECQQSLSEIYNFEKNLAENLRIRWATRTLNNDLLNSLIQSVINDVKNPTPGRGLKLPLRQTAWIVGLTIMIVGLAIISIRLTPLEKEIALPEVSVPPHLPPIVEIQPTEGSSQEINKLAGAPQYIAPAFSNDGKWAVFSEIKYSINAQASVVQTINLYSREANTIHVINESLASVNSWVWWDLAPGISGDGRRIVYVGTADSRITAGAECSTSDHRDCLDIFIYDRFTGLTKRLTQSANGGAADGDSLAPTISKDGQWVAFWSTADNLVEGLDNSCEQNGVTIACLYIYLYNVASGKVSWIPIRTIPGDNVFGVDRISLSADARYIGFTVSSSSQAGSPSLGSSLTFYTQNGESGDLVIHTYLPVIAQSSEAIIYDRDTGKYELVNQNQNGIAGDGPSSSPVISADGRYVAFVSSSANLVAGDSNNSSDVFVRDRITGQVEIISKSSSGQLGRKDSGFIFSARGYYSLNISDDGRYVIFESAAGNLGNDGNQGCNLVDNRECQFLYVHDRDSSSTELISWLTNHDFTLFPGISSDGRWVSYMQYFNNCNINQPNCSNVMLYDRLNHWTADLTGYDIEIPQLPWTFSGSIALPWQTWESPALAVSPDGIFIALGGYDSKVRIWNSTDVSSSQPQIEPVKTFAITENDSFSALVFSPNGEWLAGGLASGAVYIWELSNGKTLFSTKTQPELVRKLMFTQDSTHLIISTSHEAWTWRLSDNQMSQVDGFSSSQSEAYEIGISPNGNMIASARGDGTIWLQSLPNGELIARLGTNQVSASSLAFSVDGSLLAAHLPDGKINIWHIAKDGSETSSITLINTYRTTGYVGNLTFSQDNKYLASTGGMSGVTLWSIPEGKIFTVGTLLPDGMVYSLAFGVGRDKLAAVFENEIVIWGIPKERPSIYYQNASTDKLIDTNPNLEITSNGFPIPQSIYNDIPEGNLALDKAAAELPFQLIIPTNLPADMSFYAASVNADGSVWLRYDVFNQQAYRASFYIYEKSIGNDAPPGLTIGASADIIQTEVETSHGAVPAEYVQGDWKVSPSFTQPQPYSASGDIHNIWSWDNGSSSRRLRWQQNGVFVAFYYQPHTPYSEIISPQDSNTDWTYLNKELDQSDMLQIASGMLPYSQLNTLKMSYLSTGVESIPSNDVPWMGIDQLCPYIGNKPGITQTGLVALK